MPGYRLFKIRQHFERNELQDPQAALRKQLGRIAELIRPDARIAIGVGSRGIHNLPLIRYPNVTWGPGKFQGVDSQRTLYPVPNVRLLPAREFPQDDAARTRFRGRFRELFEGDPSKSALYRDISNGVTPGGIEYYLPLFFDTTATLAEYFPANATVAVHGDAGAAIARFWQNSVSTLPRPVRTPSLTSSQRRSARIGIATQRCRRIHHGLAGVGAASLQRAMCLPR